MIIDDDVFSQVQPGKECYETFFYELAQANRVRYAYRAPDGTLFIVIARTLADARERRNRWLESRKTGAAA